MDVGANIGVHALYFAALVGPAGKIHAFEPVPKSAAVINQAVASNGFTDRIEVNQFALSEASGAADFFVSAGIASTSSLTRYPWLADARSIRVQTTTLDDYAERLPRPIRLLKIDVEGAEMSVLTGGRRLLQQRPPDFMIVEFTTANHAHQLLAQVLSLGYEQVRLGGGKFHPVEPSAPNPSEGSPGDSDFVVQNACFRHSSSASVDRRAA
jgi:FkbM family methyltransferase